MGVEGAGVTNGWLIECCWIDKKFKDDHVQLIQLQGLMNHGPVTQTLAVSTRGLCRAGDERLR